MRDDVKANRERMDALWPEIRILAIAGESLHSLARVYGLDRRALRYRLQRAGLRERQSRGGQKVPRRSDPPYVFNCGYCGKIVEVDPATGDRRFRFCCRKCERGYWRHKDPNAGKRKDIK